MSPKNTSPLDFQIKLRHRIGVAILFFGVSLLPGTSRANAQGCSQCRDNVSQSRPEVQSGYRLGIGILIGAASLFSAAAFLIIRRSR